MKRSPTCPLKVIPVVYGDPIVHGLHALMNSALQVQSRQKHPRAYYVIFAVIAICGFTGGCEREPAAATLSAAPALQFEGLDSDAQAQLSAAYAKFQAKPESALSNEHMARLLHAYGQLQAATAYYRRARELGPDDFALAHLHGIALSMIGARKEAIDALTAANEFDPSYLPTLLKLAEMLADAGDVEASRAYFEAALLASPDQPQALFGLGKLQLESDPPAALALMRRASTVGGPFGAAHYAISQALRDSGDIEGARAHLEAFERYRGQAPHVDDPVMSNVRQLNLSRDGYLERGLKAYGEGRLETSAREFEKSLEKDPENTMARPNLIAVYGQLGRFDEAETHYLQGVQSNPSDVKLYTNYALLQLNQKNYAKAIEAYKNAIELEPAYGKSYIGIGAAHEVQGNREEAIKWYRAALENDPPNRQARQYLGAALIQSELPEQAIEVLEPAVESDDMRSAICLRLLAKAQVAVLLYDEAEMSLARAEKLARRFNQPGLARAVQLDAEAIRSARSEPDLP